MSFRHAAAMFGLHYHRPDSWEALEAALAGAWQLPGATLIELVVNETDGTHTLQQLLAQVSHCDLHARCERAVGLSLAGLFARFFRRQPSGKRWAPRSALIRGCILICRVTVARAGQGQRFAEVSLRLAETLAHYHTGLLADWLLAGRAGGDVLPASRGAAVRADRRRGPSRPAGCATRGARHATPPGRSVFAASRWRRSLPTGISSRFSPLKYAAARALVALRSRNNGATLAAMLEATSLPCSPICARRCARVSFHYLCGERDAKFRAIAATSPPRTLFIMPDTTRIGKTPRRWCCLAQILRVN
jgi:hypothetical protein